MKGWEEGKKLIMKSQNIEKKLSLSIEKIVRKVNLNREESNAEDLTTDLQNQVSQARLNTTVIEDDDIENELKLVKHNKNTLSSYVDSEAKKRRKKAKQKIR